MITADWIAIAIVLGSALLGAFLGFGRGVKFLTGGILGIIISVFICYCLGGFILELQFVGDLMSKLAAVWGNGDNFFCEFLTKMHFELVIYYILLFIVVQILRKLIVSLFRHVMEIKFLPLQIINRVFGAVLIAGVVVLLVLTIFQIIYWVGGTTASDLREYLSGGVFNLAGLFENNPLNSIVDHIKSIASGF